MRWPSVPKTLFGKLALVQTTFGALVVGGFFLILEATHERYYLESSQRENVGLAQELLHEHLEHAGLRLDDAAALQSGLRHLAGLSTGVDLYWLDPAGGVLASSVPEEHLRRKSVSLAPVRALLSDPTTFPIQGDDPRNGEERRVFSVAAFGANAEPDAYFYVVLRGSDADLFNRVTRTRFFRESMVFIVGGVLLALVTALSIIFGVLRPFREISQGMAALRRGGFQTWPIAAVKTKSGASDLDNLGADFNDMASRIALLVRQLKEEDRNMREMLTSISHDLRTPLTIVQGQLETLLLKAGQQPTADQRRFLEGALRASKSLDALVAAVFELATLQGPNFRLRLERFSLSEAVHDVSAKFDTRARARGITIATEGADRYAMMDGELALIERVLDNLLDNAIRHARGANLVTIALADDGGRLRLSVRDNGSGLPAERLDSLGQLYLTEQPDEGAPTTRSGLGLRIVSRILRLHGSALEYSQPAGGGAEFSFVLQKSMSPSTAGSATSPA